MTNKHINGKKTQVYKQKEKLDMATAVKEKTVTQKTAYSVPNDVQKLIHQLKEPSLCEPAKPGDSIEKDIRFKIMRQLNCPMAIVQGAVWLGFPGANQLIYSFNDWLPFHNWDQARQLISNPWRLSSFSDFYGDENTSEDGSIKWYGLKLVIEHPTSGSTITVTDCTAPIPTNGPLRLFAIAALHAANMDKLEGKYEINEVV